MELIFKNTLGQLDAENFKLNSIDAQFKIRKLAFVELRRQPLKGYKYFSLILMIIGLFSFFFEFTDAVITFIIGPMIVIFTLIYLFLELGYSFIQIINTNATKTQVRIKRSELKEASDLVKEFNKYRSRFMEFE